MGSHDGVGDADERPRHQVTVPAFCIDRTELTQAAYLAFVRATRRPEPGPCEWNGEARWQPEGTYANHPVACVSWHDARAYCEWARKRLPSEAEWEKAARGTDERTYPWGSTPAPSCERAVMDDGRFGCGAGWALAVDRTSRPRPADGASPDGVQDLAGNVWEWVEDDWHESYAVRGRPDDGTAWVDAPRGSRRVVRGGGFWYPAVLVRAALRAWVEPDDTGAARGFRCATSVEP
jgi:formylglycine-generating enzyme required for sulfatase activity